MPHAPPAPSADSALSALVFNVQRYSIHDGPGIRTTFFLKGCPLRCQWCHNPEAISGRVEFGYFPERCIGCHDCVGACPRGVHALDPWGRRVVHRERCRGDGACGAACADVCLAEAIERIGYSITLDQAVAEAERDRPFYERSGGGVTLSGGEPLRQAEFAVAFLARCRERGLHTAIETCGYAAWPALRSAARQADLILFDVKQMDPAAHRRLTGVSNCLILRNLSRLYALPGRGELCIRYPFIPTCNDQPENYHAMGRFLRSLAASGDPARLRVDILPYHALGTSKYRKLGREYRLEGLEPPSPDALQAAAGALASYGLAAYIGSGE
ncbi:MAG TPA: glycyl-radical enzyme activating protein [Chloroflexota bacterium]|nr:glycyl-radical enzyme activating protein [Chloroflexota bacterium]